MITGRRGFNIYLLIGLGMFCVCGCRSTGDDKKKEVSTLRVNLEALRDMMDFSTEISVFRGQPITLHVDKSPLLSEIDVVHADVVEDRGGFFLQIQFDRHG